MADPLGRQQASQLGAGVSGLVQRAAKYLEGHFRGVHLHPVGGDGIVPAPLGVTDVLQNVLHLGVGGTGIPGRLGLEVGVHQLLLDLKLGLDHRLFALLDYALQHLLALGVAVAAGLIETIERVAHLVIRVDLALIVLHLGHVAVDAGDVVLAVNAGAPGLVFRMLGLEHGGPGEGVSPVGETDLVVILFHLLNRGALVPGEFHRLGGAAEVVLHVALAAHLRLLIEASLILERLADGGHGPIGIGTGEVQGRLALLELLRGGVVAVGAADGVDDFRPPLGPHPLEVAIFAFLIDNAGHIRAFAAPAGHWQRAIFGSFWGAGAQGLAHIGQGIKVAAWLVVILGKGVTAPQHDHIGIFCQRIGARLALAGGLPAGELIGVILGEQLTARLYLALGGCLISLCKAAGAKPAG